MIKKLIINRLFSIEILKMATRPELKKDTNVEVFKQFYWDKKELVAFCNNHGLYSDGGKIEISERIAEFLKSGKKISPKSVKVSLPLDSDGQITKTTKVRHYKNDAKTKEFFTKHIGSNFHFNGYLRVFAKRDNSKLNVTYGDLIDGWKKEEEEKKKPDYKTKILPQFQYNQFQRDFYANEKGKTRQEFINAWKLVRSVPGEATYEHYKELKQQESEKIKQETSSKRKNDDLAESKSSKRKIV